MSDWETLKKYSQARIGLGRAGYAVSTKEHLKFQFDHARARDAVHWKWDVDGLKSRLMAAGMASRTLQSQVRSRAEYLTRPDLGRLLQPAKLKATGPDIAIVISNGLSAHAVENHGFGFVKLLWQALEEADLKLSPVFLIENARVALSDAVGAQLKAKMVLMILGERPGLTSFDSLALYLTYGPKPGNSDALRNCISNIRPPDGLSYENAVRKTWFLVHESFRRKLSGVQLKEEDDLSLAQSVSPSALLRISSRVRK